AAELDEACVRGLRARHGYLAASARRGRITARAEAAMAAATITTKNSMTSLAAKYSVATPRMTTGTVSPTYAPRKKPARTSARDSGGAVPAAAPSEPRK